MTSFLELLRNFLYRGLPPLYFRKSARFFGQCRNGGRAGIYFIQEFSQPFPNSLLRIAQRLSNYLWVFSNCSPTSFQQWSAVVQLPLRVFPSSYKQKRGNFYPFSLIHMIGLCPSIHPEPKCIQDRPRNFFFSKCKRRRILFGTLDYENKQNICLYLHQANHNQLCFKL